MEPTQVEVSDGATAHLADFIVSWHPPKLDATTLREAKRALTDVLGVIMVGSVEEPARIVADIVRHEGCSGSAVVIGHGFRSSASFSAMVNGTAGHALDFDDLGKVPGTGHPTVCVAPAALAIAEELDRTGRDLIEALVVGFEVIFRLGRSAGGESGDAYKRGFHGTSIFGVFGATAAACRLMGLNSEQTCIAFGLASSAAKGVRANYGTMTKALHAGEANRAGVIAASLARGGFTANVRAIEARFGWADAVAGTSFDASQLTNKPGSRVAIDQGVKFKRYPTCGANDAVISAVLALITENGLRPDDVDEFEVLIAESVMKQTLIYPWPTTGLQGKFSLAFNVAAAWVDGKVVVSTFSDDKVHQLEPYRSRIQVGFLEDRTSIVAVAHLIDGRTLRREEPTGLLQIDRQGTELPPIHDDELNEKFRENISVLRSDEHARELLKVLNELEDLRSVRDLAALLL